VTTPYTQTVTERAIVAKTGLVARELDGSFCLVDPETWQVAVLNHTASDLWRLIQAGCSLEEIMDTLAAGYDADPATIGDDVRAALAELDAGGFLVDPSA
jgi:hypothetical protein